MSLEAMVWALKKAPVDDALEHLILIGLADHAGSDGTGARPSATTLAQYARCSVRTVRYRLRALEEAGLIRRGDQRMVEHLRADRRPVVYDLNLGVQMVHGVQDVHPATPSDVQDMQAVDDHGVHSHVERGAQPRTDGVHAGAHKPSKNHPVVTNVTTTVQGFVVAIEGQGDPFDEFWRVYPRRHGKGEARKSFAKAVRRCPADRIIAAAAAYAADPNRVDQFTALPATWLNQDRWDDDPLQPRQSARQSETDGLFDRAMQRAQAREAGGVR